MKVRRCLERGCPTLTTSTRCTSHTRSRDRARGTRQERGYDAHHDAVGVAYQEQLDAGVTLLCWRCGKPVGPRRGLDWQLGHCDDDGSVHHGPEHSSCNLATSGRAGQDCPHPSHAT